MNAREDAGLLESRNYTKAIINTGELVAVIDESYKCLFASNVFVHYLGMKKTDVTGRAVPEVIGEDIFKEKIKPYIDRCLSGRRATFEMSIPDSRYGDRFFHVKCYPVKEQGKMAAVILAMDITMLKQREQSLLRDQEMYRIVLKKANDILLIMNPDGIIVSCSRYVDQQTGISSNSIIGQSVKCLLMPQSYAKVVRHLEEWKSFRARSREWEAEVVGRSGEVVPFEVHSTPVYEQRGLKYVVIIARNISERKSLEERLRSNYAELETKIGMLEQESQEKLREMKEEFNRLSGRILEDQERERHAIGRELHDEMGGYLTILGIYLGKMAKEPGNRAWQDQFTQAFDEMVQYIRSLSHSLYPVMLERGDLLSALMTYFENFQRRIGVKIDFKYRGLKERLPSHIEAVAYRIIQEALTNVAKHAAAQNVKVTIFRLKSVVKLSVEDDGRGFDLSRTRTEGAYGISGMKNRALFAGGNLEVESSPGRGTRVVSTLPVSSNG